MKKRLFLIVAFGVSFTPAVFAHTLFDSAKDIQSVRQGEKKKAVILGQQELSGIGSGAVRCGPHYKDKVVASENLQRMDDSNSAIGRASSASSAKN